MRADNKKVSGFYSHAILQDLAGLAELQQKQLKKYCFRSYVRNLFILIALIIGIGVSGEILDFNPVPIMAPLGFILVLYAIIRPLVIVVKRNGAREPIARRYRTEIVPKLIRHFFSDSVYMSDGGLNQQEIRTSLFSTENPRPLSFSSGDLIYGTRNGLVFRLSNVNFTYLRTQFIKRKSKNMHDGIVREFGAYALFRLPVQVDYYLSLHQVNPVLDFAKQAIDGYIDSKKTHLTALSNVIGHFAGEGVRQVVMGDMYTDVIRTGEVDFDKLFTLISDNESAARQLFDSTRCQAVLALLKNKSIQLHAELVGDELHIALPYVNLFEFCVEETASNGDLKLRDVDAIEAIFGFADLVLEGLERQSITSFEKEAINSGGNRANNSFDKTN